MSLGTTEKALTKLRCKKEFIPFLSQLRDFLKTQSNNTSVNVYFVYTDKSMTETEVIKKIKPERLLMSYFYFRNKSLGEVVDKLGYIPEILLDSGAFSALTKGNNISLIDYMNYIERNKAFIKDYIALDVIGDSDITYSYYNIMRDKGLKPIPVYHYGENHRYLDLYINDGNTFIALGGTVPIKDKDKVAAWANLIIKKHPDTKFHLLGSNSKKITESCNLFSCDSSTWIMGAVNGKVKHIPSNTRDDKIKRAEFLMNSMINAL